MYSLEEVFMIRELHKDGVAVTEISEIMNCSRTTVYKYLSSFPETQIRTKRPSKLDPYKPYILKRVLEDGVTNCMVLLDEIKEMGYPGSRTILREFVQPYRESPKKQAPVRFETEPGEQAQVDWVHLGRHYVDGKQRQLYGFLMTLSYSRMRYLEVTTSMELKTLIRVHMNAFVYFKGIPRTVVYDNMKTVVQRRLANEIILTRQFADFSDYYGFEVKLCKPGNPRSKGKVENFARYVRKNFIPRKRSGNTLEAWNNDALVWLETTANVNPNWTTGVPPKERFGDEITKLLPITEQPAYVLEEWELRQVSSDGFISVKGLRYSVPITFAGKEVEIRHVTASTIHVRYRGVIIAEHSRPDNPFKLVVSNPLHNPIKKEQALWAMSSSSPHIEHAPEATSRPLAWYQNLLEEVSRND